MEAWFQKFEAEERRQRMIMEAMKEQKSSHDSKPIDKEPSGEDDKTKAEVAAAWNYDQRSKTGVLLLPSNIHPGQLT